MRFGISACLLALTFLFVAFVAGADSAADLTAARKDLFADRFENAAKLYSRVIEAEPSSGDAWYGLVRAELEGHQSRQASADADAAVQRAPGTPGAETAAGLTAWRRGDLHDAEGHFRAALKLNPNYPGALQGMAKIFTALSKFRTARDLRLKAWEQAPDDPELILAHATTLKGPEYTAALEKLLPFLDPESEEARVLQIRIANDRAIGDTKLWHMVSPYKNSTIKLAALMQSAAVMNGLGVRVQLNGKQTATLLLDTGTSGISLSPKIAERAGLQTISGNKTEVRGVGDEKAPTALSYLASEVHIGDVTFANVPVAVFQTTQVSAFDGLIGADVFQQFLVKIDFPRRELVLETRARGAEPADEPVDRGDTAPPGFTLDS